MQDLRYDVSLAGRDFMVSRKGGRFGRRSIPLQKAQQDTSDAQGEQSLNPEDLWRRSFESWHRGAGQSSFDRAGGDPFRFDSSWGVNPWNRWELSLLNDTEQKLASTASSVRLAVAGDYLYVADGQILKYTQSITAAGAATWTTVAGTPVADITGIASDGYNVWIAFGASGVYSTTRGAATASLYNGINATSLGFVKGRLMAGYGRSLYNITGASPTISHVGYESKQIPTGGGRVTTVNVPTGAEPGDFLLLRVMLTALDDSVLTPAGWTILGSVHAPVKTGAVAFYKIAELGDANVNITTNFTTTASVVTLAAYRNVSAAEPIERWATNSGSNASPAATIGATSHAGVMVVFGAFINANATFTPPTGYTERYDGQNAGNTFALTSADKVEMAVSGSTTVTGTASVAGEWVTTVIALRPNQPSPLFDHPSTEFRFVGFAEGHGVIYAAGYSGDKSLIYRTGIKTDGTGLESPVVAGSLPDGEITRSIYGYLGLVFIGTDSGLRMATSDANGDLTIGSLIETPGPVRCFEGQGRHVWFGLEDFDISRWSAGTLDGLGRLDLTQLTEALVPAWASDLMVAGSTGTTEAVDVVTFQDRRIIAVADSAGASRGVYAETATKVATGYLDSGLITYGIADTKVATYLDVRTKPLVGSLQVYLSTDSGAFGSVGTVTTAGSTRTPEPLNVGPSRGDTHEVRVRLNRASPADAVGPTLTRLTLRSEPAPARGRIYQVPLILSRKLNVVGQEVSTDPAGSLAFIEGLFDTQTLVAYREGNTTTQVFVKDYEFVAEHQTADRKAEQGICTLTLKSPGS